MPSVVGIRDALRSLLGNSPLRAPARRLFQAYGSRRGLTATVDGITMRYVIGSEPVEQEPAQSDWVRYADYVMSRAFIRAIKQGSIVADVGAFKGGYSILAAGAAGPTGYVVAFEPAAANHAAIERNIQLNGLGERVTLCGKAVSDRVGTVSFFSAGEASENSLYSAGVGASQRAAGEITSTTVETIDLDTFFADRRDPDVLKIDAEGAELSVLRGAERILASGASVICELHPYAWEQAGHDENDLVQWLAERGRTVIDLRTGRTPDGKIAYGPYSLNLAESRT